ncbi:MAG: nucleotidyltransferase family protein [Thioploca sp.]|nr:nucleotidyltransferase family protein [Thioploca sp.]
MKDLSIDSADLATICRQYHVRRLAVFGSCLHGNQRDDSDIDILVEFEEGKTLGLGFFTLQHELSVLLARTVDLNTPNFLSRYFRAEVMAEARDLSVA